MNSINPPLPAGQTLMQLNPSLAFSYELAQHFVGRKFDLSLEDTPMEYQEIQVGYTKRVTWSPYVSIHTADLDMSIKHNGQGAGMRARKLDTEFAVLVRLEYSDEQLGRAALTDIQWDVANLLAGLSGGGQTYKYLDIQKLELVGITPEEVTEQVPWAFSGQVLALGSVHFKD